MNSDRTSRATKLLDQLPALIANRFEVMECIGRGGVGVVLKCKDVVLNNIVAVKFLLKEINQEEAARFQREAVTAARLNHRNIVRVVDFGQNQDGRLYLVMEYLEGKTLLDEIEAEGPYSISAALPLLLKICDGLSHAHNLNVLHRDVKPSNVMLAEEPGGKIVPKLVDFGLARIQSQMDEQQLTTGGRVFGSPSYLSPESATGGKVDFRTDIYSLGCLIFEALSGTPPFLGETAFETLNQKISQRAPTLFEKTGKRFPEEIEQIVARCLDVDPEQRYESVSDLRQDLEELYELDSIGGDFMQDEDSEEIDVSETLILQAYPDSGSSSNSHSKNMHRRLNYKAVAVVLFLFLFGISALFLTVQSILFPEIRQAKESDSDKEFYNLGTQSYFYREEFNGYEWLRYKGYDLSEALRELSIIKKVNAVRIKDQDLRGVSLEVLRSKKLHALTLDECKIDDGTLEEISKMTDLNYLDLSECKGFGEKGALKLSRLKYLKRLDLHSSDVTDAVFEAIQSLRLLTFVDLTNCHFQEGRGMENLVNLPLLNTLALGGASVDLSKEGRLSFLQDCTKLRQLSLSYMPITNDDLVYIKDLPLRKLYLTKAMIDDAGLERLREMKTLRELGLFDCLKVTVGGIKELRKAIPGLVVTTK